MKAIPRFCLLAALSLLPLDTGQASDPSLAPATDPGNEDRFAERWRVRVDLDDDGDDDLLLSEPTTRFGTMGGSWTVFLRDSDSYREIGTLTAHPRAISLEPDKERMIRDPSKRVYARAWVYLRGSGSEGSFGYYRIGFDKVSDFQGVVIYPGDGGSSLGRAIYQATFSESPLPYRLEYSETSPDGEVSWKESE